MQVAPVDDEGTTLAYWDSGAVEGDTYTTLVCVHGHTYHAQTFRRMLESASKNNLRLVAINRRHYPGSTPYSDEELDKIHKGDTEAFKIFMAARGLEIANFLVWFVKHEAIPPASQGGTAGGLALIGWSAGNMTTTAFFRHANKYPADIVQTLEPYLRTLFIYDASNSTLGFPTPPGCYNPFISNDEVPERLRGLMTGLWVSSYFQHPSLSSRSLDGLQQRPPISPDRPPTLETLDPKDLIALVDPEAGKIAEAPFYRAVSVSTMYDQTRSVLFPDEPRLFPRLKVCMFVCTSSIWSVQYGSFKLQDEIKYWTSEGRHSRPFSMIHVEGANHFLHWDKPELLLRLVSENV